MSTLFNGSFGKHLEFSFFKGDESNAQTEASYTPVNNFAVFDDENFLKDSDAKECGSFNELFGGDKKWDLSTSFSKEVKECNCINSKLNMNNSVSFSGSNKESKFKKVILSSEQIELEKIKKQKEELKKLKLKNENNVEKCKMFISKPLNPTPLTLMKPFNLSCNNSKMLMKKRITTSNTNEIINQKITNTMKQRVENADSKIKDSMFINNRIILNKTPTNLKFMKKTDSQDDPEVNTLSSRIEKHCLISKSPLKLNFGNDMNLNEKLLVDNILNKKIENKINNNSFESVMMKTRIEKQTIDKNDKDMKKLNKLKQIKINSINKENFNSLNLKKCETNETLEIDGLMLVE